jgi:hypothetical protein
MLDEHTKKKKPAGDQKKHPRINSTLQPHTLQEKGPEHQEPLPEKSEIEKEEVIGLPDEWVLETERRPESPLEKPADSSSVPLPEIHSAVKSAMKSALLPKPDFQKPARRPKILPVVIVDEEPLPAVGEDSPDTGDNQDSLKNEDLRQPSFLPDTPDTWEEPGDAEDTSGIKNPPYCKDCGKKLPAIANFCPMCGTCLGVSFQPRDPKRQF